MSVEKLENKAGSLASGYRSTLTSIDILMRALNELQAAGKLPESAKLTSALIGIFAALKLGKLHFPSLHLKGCRELPEDPCPLCGASKAAYVPTVGSPDTIRSAVALALVDEDTGRLLDERVYGQVRNFLAQCFTVAYAAAKNDDEALRLRMLWERITR